MIGLLTSEPEKRCGSRRPNVLQFYASGESGVFRPDISPRIPGFLDRSDLIMNGNICLGRMFLVVITSRRMETAVVVEKFGFRHCGL